MPTDDYMASDEEVVGVPNGKGGAKRYRTEGQGSASAAPEAANLGAKGTRQEGVPVATALGNLPATVGKGEFEQPLMEAVLSGMRDLAMEVADLKGAIYHAWEGPPEWDYVTKGIEYRKHYSDQCRAAKGTGTSLGHMKNYVAMGLVMAYRGDKTNSRESNLAMEELVGQRLRNKERKMDLMNARQLADLVAHCQVVKTKKKSFVNILGTNTPEGQRFMTLIEAALEKEGTRQWDPAPSKPVHKDLKIALETAKRHR